MKYAIEVRSYCQMVTYGAKMGLANLMVSQPPYNNSNLKCQVVA